MKVYLAGPMRGRPYFNFPEFAKATEMLRGLGHEVFSPAEADIARAGYDYSGMCPKGTHEEAKEAIGFTIRLALAEDINWICLRAEAIALLPGWTDSKGASAEYHVAEALGLEVIRLAKDNGGHYVVSP